MLSNRPGMFGNLGKTPLPGPVSGYGGGTFNMDGTQATQPDQTLIPQPMPAEQEKDPRWLEGGKFGWQDAAGLALGAIGDALSGQPTTAQMVQGSFQQNRATKLAEQQREQSLADKLWLAQQKRAEPNPTELERNYDFLSRMNPDLGQQYITNRANPIQGVPVTNADGSQGIMFVRPGGMGRQTSASAPSPSVGTVEDGYRFKGGNPADPNAWEPVGQGGPSLPATGGFRP